MALNPFGMIPGQDTAKIPKSELYHLMTFYQYQTKAGIRQQVRILKNNSEGLNIFTCKAINNSMWQKIIKYLKINIYINIQ